MTARATRPESWRALPDRAPVNPSRELALSLAQTVTRASNGRGVFAVAALFTRFLDEGRDDPRRFDVLLGAVIDGTGQPPDVIVGNARRSLASIDPTRGP